MVETATYIRKPFSVEAIRITQSNMNAVADWCEGSIRAAGEGEAPSGKNVGELYVQVRVSRPISPRQTRAFVGDWILKSISNPGGFKVYTDWAFRKDFEEVVVEETEANRGLAVEFTTTDV